MGITKEAEKEILPLKFAPWWKRVISFVIDFLIVNIIFSFILFFVYRKDMEMFFTSPENLELFLKFISYRQLEINLSYILIFISYFGILWYGIAQTIGGKVMKIYVIDIKGKKLNIFLSLARASFLYVFYGLLFIPLIFVVNPVYHQRIHDFITNSVVVEKPEFKDEKD